MANRSDETTRELVILQVLKERANVAHPGHKHVSDFIESFHHEGPNGRHLCVVMGLLGPQVSSLAENSPECRLDGSLARSISRQLLLAVDYLHSVGVAHGGKSAYS
jgi:serine/threonine-protein kinase SRPK3